MALKVRCPTCEKAVRVAEADAGSLGVCVACGTKVVIPPPPLLGDRRGKPGHDLHGRPEFEVVFYADDSAADASPTAPRPAVAEARDRHRGRSRSRSRWRVAGGV